MLFVMSKPEFLLPESLHVMQDVLPERDTQAGKVPTAWIPPYKGPSQRPPPRSTSSRRLPLSYSSPTHSSETSSMNTRSRFSLSGLGGVLTSPSMHSGWAGQQSGVGSSPKGMTDAGQVAALFQESTRSAAQVLVKPACFCQAAIDCAVKALLG